MQVMKLQVMTLQVNDKSSDRTMQVMKLTRVLLLLCAVGLCHSPSDFESWWISCATFGSTQQILYQNDAYNLFFKILVSGSAYFEKLVAFGCYEVSIYS